MSEFNHENLISAIMKPKGKLSENYDEKFINLGQNLETWTHRIEDDRMENSIKGIRI